MRPAKRNIPYLIDKILPRYGVHLLGGASGAGKSIWLFQFLNQWHIGKHVLGLEEFECIPCPWAYVACDRTGEDTWRTIDQIGFRPDEALVMSWDEEVKKPKNLGGLQSLIDELPIEHGLLIIEDLASLMGEDADPNCGKSVRKFMRSLRAISKTRDVTILGTVHTAKARPGDEYKAPRQRIAGSVEWGHYAGTVFLIAQDNEVGPERTLWYQPRHYGDGKIPVLMTNLGTLVMQERELLEMALNEQLKELEAGQNFSRVNAITWGEDKGISVRSVERWLKTALDEGLIERVGRGIYRKTLRN